MGKLADIVKERSPYLKLENGESVEATYKGYKIVPSTFDPEKERFRFMIDVEINGKLMTKYWDTDSSAVAMAFDKCKSGDKVKITKTTQKASTGREVTRWLVEPLNAPLLNAKVVSEPEEENVEAPEETGEENEEVESKDLPF